jgi:hypothetical protein
MILRMQYLLEINIVFFFVLLSLDVRAQPDFTADITEGCTPLKVKFSIDPATVNMDTITRIEWNFGTGDTLTSLDPDTVVYTTEGTFTVIAVINNHRSSPIIKTDYITVHRTIIATFRFEEYASNSNYRFIPLDEITDDSAIYFFTWRYENLDGTDTRVNTYILTRTNQSVAIDSVTLDTGVYRVQLIIDDTFGCFSRSADTVQVATTIRIPNLFIPAIEGFFIIDPQNLNTILKFEVYNRYGMLVFSQESPIINWNGKNNAGDDLNTGVYFYILKSVKGDPSGRYAKTKNGFIHLYR